MAEHRTGAQPLAHAAQQKQQQAVADGDADALGDGLFHRLLHAAEAIGQQRLHHQHGQIDAQHQQAHAEQPIQDGVCRQIDHRRAARIEDAAGPKAVLMAIGVAASCAFATPVGTPPCTLVLGPGGYKFMDYVKVGVPLVILCFIVSIIVIPMVWPFFPG